MYHMIIEQTKEYKKRMKYHSDTNTFFETDYDSLLYVRGFDYPYGWIKETGTPPDKHFDCILMDDNKYNLGDEVMIKIIGVFYRNDKDHKFITVLHDSSLCEYDELKDYQKQALENLYPIQEGLEGFYGKDKAKELLSNK